MDILIRFGLSIEEIKNMMDTNHEIEEVSDKEITSLIDILKSIDCKEEDIKNILLCNPFCITKNTTPIQQLIKKLQEIGCTYINLLLETNPYLLNMDADELDKLYNKKSHEGFSKDEILNEINYNILF